LGGIGFLAGEGFARAQYNPYGPYYQAQLQQNVLNTQLAAQAVAQQYSSAPLQAQALSPYAGGYGSPYGGYGNAYNPFSYYNSPGATLMGEADVMRSLGKVVNDQEEARLKRELANQAKLQTIKNEFDLRMYIKANTPTYTQEQERIAKTTLRRIQTNSLPGEVSNGKALNYLLDDLRKFPGKKVSLEPLMLSEGVLAHLNVTKNTFGVGLLRDEGRVTLPTALREILTEKQRTWLNLQLEDLVKEANKGRLDANVLRDVRAEMDRLRDDLVKKVNETPTTQYFDAKRFLHEFHEATVALERGEAPVQAKFQRYVEGGKSVQEVIDYMVQNGLRFASATATDEPAYRAIHSMLASYNIAMNSSLGAEPKE
jgi:hypothetical protein